MRKINIEPFASIRKLSKPGELVWSDAHGIGYYPVDDNVYDQAYFEKYMGYENTNLGHKLTDFRNSLVNRYYRSSGLIDIGIGSGQFVEYRNTKGLFTFGYDVNAFGVLWLEARKLFLNPHDYFSVRAISCWDSFEHIKEPELLVAKVTEYVFISIPIFRDESHCRGSKHFRKDEHYWYFTRQGLTQAMRQCGFLRIHRSKKETELGREDIESFVFERIEPWAKSQS